uniref:Novel STAND NTPase 1 domain-containing protein n=1 Tax=Candidatus Kentrum sp. FW TaxID=2126338 RepID=A0A450TZR5_9GAMM|nr:MAG: hypothetical protein BECKFW1821C_GA0114237_107916 [Candidatus Kentron sp. FW]
MKIILHHGPFEAVEGAARTIPLGNAGTQRQGWQHTDAAPPTLIIPIDQGEELFVADGGEENRQLLSLLRAVVSPMPDIEVGWGERSEPQQNTPQYADVGVRAEALTPTYEPRAAVTTNADLGHPMARENDSTSERPLLLIAIRSDSYQRLQTDPHLDGIEQYLFSLPPMARAEYGGVIQGPAARQTAAGQKLSIEPALTEQLIEDAEGADALPLLAFTLERLFMDYGGDGDLLLSEYRELGGIGGSIDKAIGAAFANPNVEPVIPADQQEREKLLRQGFLPWLALIDPDTDERKRRVARWREIPADARPLVERLIGQRLLVRDRRKLDDEEAIVVEVAHEALLRQWPLLSRWLDEDADALKAIQATARAAADWAGNERNPAWLIHRGERLGRVEALLLRPDLDRLLGDQGRTYVRACREREDVQAAEAERQRKEKEEAEKRRLQIEKEQAAEREQAARDRAEAARGISRRTGVGAVIAVVLMLVAGALAWWAIQQERAAQRSLANNYWTSGRNAEKGNDPVTAGHFYARATEKYPDKIAIEAGRLKLRTLQMDRNPMALDTILGHDGSILGAAFSKDESRILTWSEDKTARLWGPKAGTQGMTEIARMAHDGEVSGAAFSKDESRILTWNGYRGDNAARLWRAGDGTEVARMGHDGWVFGAAFSKDESRILTWSSDDTARLWGPKAGTELARMGHNDWVRGAAFSKDESRILTWSEDNTAQLWRAEDGTEVARMGHDGDINGAVFSKDESRILTWSQDKTARLWDLGVDYDFPLAHLALRVEVLTGTAMDRIGNIRVLGAEEWQRKKEKYDRIAKEHAENCQYPEANRYLKRKAHAPEESSL